MITTLVVDDHKGQRNPIRDMLAMTPDFDIIAEARDGRQALELAKRLMPDIVVTDIGSLHQNWLSATRQLAARAKSGKFLIVAASEQDCVIVQARQDRATGYIVKIDTFPKLLSAFRAVHAGTSSIKPDDQAPYATNRHPAALARLRN